MVWKKELGAVAVAWDAPCVAALLEKPAVAGTAGRVELLLSLVGGVGKEGMACTAELAAVWGE